MQGTYDEIIEYVSGRDLYDLQPELVDILRLACHQAYKMRTPVHATVDTTVNLAGVVLGERVTGLVNAVVRKLCRVTFDEIVTKISGLFGAGRPRFSLRTSRMDSRRDARCAGW